MRADQEPRPRLRRARLAVAEEWLLRLMVAAVPVGFGLVVIGAMSAHWLTLVVGTSALIGGMLGVVGYASWRTRRTPALVFALGHPTDGAAAQQQLIDMGSAAVPLLLEGLWLPRNYASSNNDQRREWDGSLARQRAAQALARLGSAEAVAPLCALLEDQDDATRHTVAAALGAIGDPRAVPALLRVLGTERRRLNYDTAVHAAAVAALGKLGQDGLVERFRAALGGQADALEPDLSVHGAALTEALVEVLHSPRPIEASGAARALQHLGLSAALPRLRRRVRAGGEDIVLMACQDAITQLERLSDLPRAAEQPSIATAALPRMAEAEPVSEPPTVDTAIAKDDP